MKTLYLLRHAKAVGSEFAGGDFQRPLSDAGLYEADLVSDHLSSLLPPPKRVLCSPAVRTRQTLDYFLEVWPQKEGEIRYDDELYLAPGNAFFEHIQKLPKSKEIALLVGHNPGLTAFARQLLQPESEEIPSLGTSDFLQFDFEVNSWKEVTPHTGRMKLHVRPGKLER